MEATLEEQSSVSDNIDYSKYIINLVLSEKTRTKLSTALNQRRCLPTDDGLPKDWRGLASLVGLNVSDISATESDPTDKILEIWFERHKSSCTIKNLKKFICKLDRWDVYDDTKEMIDNDIKRYIRLQHECANPAIKTNIEEEETALTTHDVVRLEMGLTPQYYDAFVLFSEADIEFATNLMYRLENTYELKLCTKNRDLLGGHTFEHQLITRLISERCNRLLIIVTQAFLDCPLYNFFIRFSQCIGIEQQMRKVVPLKLENCLLPKELSFYHVIDYTKRDTFQNFWDKLYLSLKTIAPYEIKRRATTISSAQNRPVIPPRPNSAPPINDDNELKLEDYACQKERIVQFDKVSLNVGNNGTKQRNGRNLFRKIFGFKFSNQKNCKKKTNSLKTNS